MRWIEIIRLRASGTDRAAIHAELERALERVLAEPGAWPDLVEVALHTHAVLEGDLALHLVWSTAEPRATAPGLTLAELLRGFGLVDHSMWKEEHTCRSPRPSSSPSSSGTTRRSGPCTS